MVDNLRTGVAKFKSYQPIYGFWKTVRELGRNVLLIEMFYRLEKDLFVLEETCQATIPLILDVLRTDGELADWSHRQELVRIRGTYGVDQFGDRLQNGDVAIYATANGKLAGFTWLSPKPLVKAGYALGNDEAYTYDSWTFEPYRGKRVLPVILQATMRYARENYRGVHTLVVHIAIWNRSSIAGYIRSGYHIVRKELALGILGVHHKFPLRTRSTETNAN